MLLVARLSIGPVSAASSFTKGCTVSGQGSRLLSSMASATQYDAVIIGSGQGGTPLAGAFAKAGFKTALVESSHIGGCCVNEGCTPTKTMIASGRVAHLARRGLDYGIHTSGKEGKHNSVYVDMEKVRQRKRDIVSSFRGGGEARAKSGGVNVFMGEGSFRDSKTLAVVSSDSSTKILTSDLFFISTGERPAEPKLEGLGSIASEFVLNSTTVQELGEVPGHLVVIGGGVVGLEFGQLMRRLGAQVTIIQRGGQLLPREDADIAKAMLEILTEDGITVHLNSNPTGISQSTTANESFTLAVNTANGKQDIGGSHLLFAAGRVPNTDRLNLPAAGIKTTSRGYVVANERLETVVPGIYAMGDVKGPPAFTHISYDDFRILRANLIEKKTATPLTTKDRVLPYVVYTDPQLGHVGLHEAEARAKFPDRKIQVAKMPMTYVARALETDETRGVMKAVVDGNTGKILGFTCLGIEGGEVMSVVQAAMMGEVGYEKLQDAVWAHPTLAESLNNLWGFLE